MTKEECCWGKCAAKVHLHYLTKPLCSNHWKTLCKMEDQGLLERIEKSMGMVPGTLTKALKRRKETET